MQKNLIAVCGPTASGKTALSIAIAKKYNGEVVSCDSMQIYKGMDIGTAKPTKKEMDNITHHMIDIIHPEEIYSVKNYKEDAEKVIDDILSRKKLPVLAGGTGLYMDSVLNNVKFSESEDSSKERDRLYKIYEEKGKEYMHLMLERIDPLSAEKIHPNNIRRVIRALEIYYTTGKTMTQANEDSVQDKKYNSLIIGLKWDRDVLYERINKRVDMMIEDGLLKEVTALKNAGIGKNTTSMQAIGYKEIYSYLDGEISLNEAVELIKQESRRYAKRQMTWLNRNNDIKWIEIGKEDSLNEIFSECMAEVEAMINMI